MSSDVAKIEKAVLAFCYYLETNQFSVADAQTIFQYAQEVVEQNSVCKAGELDLVKRLGGL